MSMYQNISSSPIRPPQLNDMRLGPGLVMRGCINKSPTDPWQQHAASNHIFSKNCARACTSSDRIRPTLLTERGRHHAACNNIHNFKKFHLFPNISQRHLTVNIAVKMK